jgi:hypothetical protein
MGLSVDKEIKSREAKANYVRAQIEGGGSKLKAIRNYVHSYVDVNDDNICELIFDTSKALSKVRGAYMNNTETGKLKEGDIISNRNAAMSRVAEHLGIGRLLAKSTNATVKIDGKEHRGNLMEGAKGDAAVDVTAKIQRGEADFDSSSMSGNFQKELMSLQVLDILCGQVDRHLGNYFVSGSKNEDGKNQFDSIQGIDNDMAFGDIGDVSKYKALGTHYRSLKSFDGKNTIPLISKDLAHKIFALNGDSLKYLLGDIISDKEGEGRQQMTAMIDRLDKLQNHILNLWEQEQQDGKKRLLDDSDWGNDSLHDLVDNADATTRTDAGYNYVARFMLEAGMVKGKDGNLRKYGKNEYYT